MKNLDKFYPSSRYHIFNHAVGNENLFRTDANCAFFLDRFHLYLSPVCKVFAYCLMPNHFHFLVEIRDEDTILKLVKAQKTEGFDYHRFIMQRLSNFLNCYSKSYNNRFVRRGALFIDYTKRIEIKDHLSILIVAKYIHLNPIKHGFCERLNQWAFSSYLPTLYRKLPSIIDQEFMEKYFEDREKFIEFHKEG